MVLFNMGHIFWQNNQQDEALQHWVEVYRIANKLKLAKILLALEQLADQLELPGDGLDDWETLAREQDVTRPDSEMRDNEEKQICDEKR